MRSEQVTSLSLWDSFDSGFKMVNPNGKYDPAKIKLFYCLIGQAMHKHPITTNSLEIDMRDSFGLCIESGLGKESFKNVISETCKNTGQEYASLVSLHEEQLIGKKWLLKGEPKDVKGYFDKDVLVRDDGLLFINSPKYELARNYMLTNLDVYGKNNITKRLVEMEDGLDYLGKASFIYFIQPSEKIIEQNLASGLFRRAPILRIDLTQEEIEEIIDKRISTEYKPETKNWYDFLRSIRSYSFIKYKKIEKDQIDQINEIVKQNLVRNGLLGGLSISNQNTIIKWAYINSLIKEYKKKQVTPYTPKDNTGVTIELTEESLKQAIKEFLKVYKSINSFVSRNTEFVIKHPIDKLFIILLKRKKCISESTSILSPGELIALAIKKSGMSFSSVKKRLYILKDKKVIGSVQLGKNGGKVWLI